MSEVTAQLNRLRVAPRKVRAVANFIKGKDVVKALYQLEFLMKRSAPHLIKLLKSAISKRPDFAIDESNWRKIKPAVKKARAEIAKEMYG